MLKNQKIITDILSETGGHLTAEEIFFEIKKREKKMSLATVYNSLHALCENKIIRKIPSTDGKDRYDKIYVPHGHLICKECGSIKDFCTQGVEKAIYKETGVKPLSYVMTVYYICDECKNKKN